MAKLEIRWSEHEARKPYARPFGVSFAGDAGEQHGSVALNGQDLLYLRQFQAAVLALSGELFADPSLLNAADPQRAWLERIASLLPALDDIEVVPRSSFEHTTGRVFGFAVRSAGSDVAAVDAPTLLEYQDFQAALAHQCGRLYRQASVENVEDPAARQVAWMRLLARILRRPDAGEAMTEQWPWR